MTILSVVLLNLLIINIRLWFMNNVINIFRYDKKIIIQTLYLGIVGAGSIYMYPRIMNLLGKAQLSFTNNISSQTIGIFVVYLIAWSIIFIWRNQKNKWKQSLKVFIYCLASIGIGRIAKAWIGIQWIELTSIFFLIIAAAEERVKRAGGFKNYQKYYINRSDIIIFAVITALGFSFRENILLGLDGTNTLARVPMYLMHAIFSALIAFVYYINTKKEQKNHRIFIGVALTIVAHTIYNNISGKTNVIMIIMSVLIGYYLLTITLYNSHSIYIAKN